jgi:hypothetical protein
MTILQPSPRGFELHPFRLQDQTIITELTPLKQLMQHTLFIQ